MMRRHRFTALDNQTAMLKVYNMLAPEAWIYSTRKIPNGIEVLAGIPKDDEEVYVEELTADEIVPVQNNNFDPELLDKLHLQLEVMDERIQKLSNYIHVL